VSRIMHSRRILVRIISVLVLPRFKFLVRMAFAFDRRRVAILLVAGDKSGGSQKRFYRELLRKADERFDAHLARVGKGT
jgi:hypothetical protein